MWRIPMMLRHGTSGCRVRRSSDRWPTASPMIWRCPDHPDLDELIFVERLATGARVATDALDGFQHVSQAVAVSSYSGTASADIENPMTLGALQDGVPMAAQLAERGRSIPPWISHVDLLGHNTKYSSHDRSSAARDARGRSSRRTGAGRPRRSGVHVVVDTSVVMKWFHTENEAAVQPSFSQQATTRVSPDPAGTGSRRPHCE